MSSLLVEQALFCFAMMKSFALVLAPALTGSALCSEASLPL